MREKILSKEQKQWLIENYQTLGPDKCQEFLKITKSRMQKIKHVLGIPRYERKPEDYNINVNHFVKIELPETAYILGILWADGHIVNKNGFQVSLQLVSEDLKDIQVVFDKLGKWDYSNRIRLNRKPAGTLYTCNKLLAEYLQSLDYTIKSGVPHTKVLNIIPEHLKSYFWRGMFDGDGCLYVNLKSSQFQIGIASTYDQNWIELENLCKSMNIIYGINRSITKKGNKGSVFRICQKGSIKKFMDYIFYNYENDKIGFKRKIEKYYQIKNELKYKISIQENCNNNLQ